ncbi:glycosyltransferase family 2 protein [Subsaximicrobium wynnwilliamsii]|uniref:Glycosyltransferase family 2 protein n=1 Tax=Subsaximicrobium wynnwilliamsii TaxID=291179 RepID=A0A5C6ZH64_9FLAO|nr:glycosyltransferase family 2 protein [Subsaximicrobium wynnwilliamsii]TXD81360.1 glycosyltransferase family 2 protein [Subsaximicrobium wynnwilliamsii]TXD89056.1 glycosyltransferase family 2 protein [Subsaximicrobium wynnwilliamsii]TXE00734.1 glycosyltransferase family 2 protein [Subsaximicrobium wynnwilliamsii]
MEYSPKVSIVVPVKNGMDTLPKLMEGIQNQTCFEDCEVVVIDSGSTDNSIDFLSQFNFVKLISIDPTTFNHGATRNLGVSHANGEFVVMTVQDALPTDELWLEKMLSHFKDETIAAVCGQQAVPHHANKNPHEWFRPQSEAKAKKIHFKSKQEFLNLSPKEQRAACGWDDVNAMYRKQALLDLPFQPLVFGEDMLWAKMALEKGNALVYDASARVYHYHFQFPEYTYKRTLIAKFFIFKCFNYLDTRTYSFKSYALVVFRNFKWKCAPKWILHNFNIIRNHRKATHFLINAINNNTVEVLEKELAIKIPIGQQHTKKHE